VVEEKLRMMVLKRMGESVVLSILIISIVSSPAQAYIDPSTGSYFMQILMAGVLGGLFALKMKFGKIKARFSRLRRRDETE